MSSNLHLTRFTLAREGIGLYIAANHQRYHKLLSPSLLRDDEREVLMVDSIPRPRNVSPRPVGGTFDMGLLEIMFDAGGAIRSTTDEEMWNNGGKLIGNIYKGRGVAPDTKFIPQLR